MLANAQAIQAMVTLVVMAVVAVVSIAQAQQLRRIEQGRAAREWQSVAEALEEQVKTLEGRIDTLEAQAEANTALIAQAQAETRKAQDAEKDAARRNLRLQRDLETANRRIGQLEELCRRAGVETPALAAAGG
jgi:predicted RNase H-like nuclease (RuvC/YqgF family)